MTPSWGEADARIIEQCSKYSEKAKDKNGAAYSGPLWYLEAEGLDVAWANGDTFRQRDIIKLQASTGRDLGKKQAPDLFAQAFRAHDVTASYARVGSADSAIGRVFQFSNTELMLGGGFKKPVRLFPKEVFATDYVFSGDVRVITPRAAEGEAPANGGISTLSEDEVIAILKSVLEGKTPNDMMEAIMASEQLRSVPSVFGVPLLESATDESLVSVLQENRCMALASDGTLQPIA